MNDPLRRGLKAVRQACVLCLVLTTAASQAGPRAGGEVTLRLDHGAGAGGGMVLTLGMEGSRWNGEAWGRAAAYNYGQHFGEVVARPGAAGSDSLTVMLTVVPDTVGPGGRAEYSIALNRREDVFEGVFSGVFCDEPVSGAVHGAIGDPVIRQVAGHKPLEPGEHPRMVFRKSDMPELKRRMETPEGKAIMAMLKARAPLRMPSQVTDRHTSWMAANWGAIYQLTGEAEAAAEARRILMEEIVAKPLPLDRDDVQQAPRLLGVALAYDFCYDAWEESFRRYMAEFIVLTAGDLYRGYLESRPVLAERIDPVPWRHRNAMRVSCIGAAALAVQNDADSDGKPLRDAARMARAAERDLSEWLVDGVTGTGYCLEGSLRKSIALANGVLAFMQADRVCMGRDLSSVNPMLLVGHALSGNMTAGGAPVLGISSISIQASGRWPMGFAAVPESMRGSMRWLFDRDVGLSGKQHFDCAYPYQAAYALANYPFGVEARDPGQELPLFVADMKHGSVVFRNRWKDADDIVATLDFNASSLPGLDPRTGPQACAVKIKGLGAEWIDGVIGVKPVNAVLGGEMLYAVSERPGQAFVGACVDAAYRVVADTGVRGREKPPEWGLAPEMRFRPPERPAGKDTGIRVTRHVAIDYTGASGVPGLLVVADVLSGAGDRPWQFPVTPGARVCIVGDPARTNLTWQFAAPVDPRKVRPGSVRPEGLCLAVATLQDGKAPEVKVVSSDVGRLTATVGGQTVIFNGERLTFGK